MLSRVLQYVAIAAVVLVPLSSASPPDRASPLPWTSEVKLHHMPRSQRGSLAISINGVKFQSEEGRSEHWSFDEIRTVDLSNQRKLSLITYQNRKWRLPGDRPFVFDLKRPMPPQVATELVQRVGKPAINGDPIREAASFASIPARHTTRTGGSNGILRFRDSGIDYLSDKANDSRSWRWADIETLAHPEPFRFRITGYLETFDFELKQILSEKLFDRLWDHVYAQGLNVRQREGEMDEKVY